MMTFGICLFIVLMQFLWKYVEDLVGKGLDNLVLAELFFYAALSLIPLALPLSILLASLMAFGSLGERLELLAVKAAGVSLLRAMQPLIILIAAISIGAFFFQNEAMPRINVKFRSLLISIKQKSPELDIPEGSFYSGINNYSIYVQKKNKETKILYDVMIYDTSNGFDNMSVFVSDSALMRISADKNFLLLNLYYGQRFANFRQSGMNTVNRNSKFVPYSRENFKEKRIIIPFNANFERIAEASLEGTQISKNIEQLNHSIDSMDLVLDSINVQDRNVMVKHTYLSYRSNDSYIKEKEQGNYKELPARLAFDSLVDSYTLDEKIRFYNAASSDAEDNNSSYIFQSIPKLDLQKRIRQHSVEWHRKFTLSFACIIFFFIGAPLGAIIRKGGLGMPVVVSVLLFIVYYIIDNVGYKMARDGVWDVWSGIWLSSVMLFPLGVFLTYKAMNDSALFNAEAYGKFVRKALRIDNKIDMDRYSVVNPSTIPNLSDLEVDAELLNNLESLDSERLKDIVKDYQKYGYDSSILNIVLSVLKERGTNFFDVKMKKFNYQETQGSLLSFVKNAKITAALYLGVILFFVADRLLKSNITDWLYIIAVAGYILSYIKTYIYYFDFYKSLDKKVKKNQLIMIFISLICFPLIYIYLKKQMGKEINNIKW